MTVAAKTLKTPAYKIIDYFGKDVRGPKGKQTFADTDAANAAVMGIVRRELQRDGFVNIDTRDDLAETFDCYRHNYRVVEVGSVCGPVHQQTPEAEAWDKAYGAIKAKIAAKLGKTPCIHYELGGEDENGIPIDNLDDVAFEGKVCFIEIRDYASYVSPIIVNPTFLDVAVHCHAAMRKMGDKHHIFLSGAGIIGHQYTDGSGFKLVGFSMES